MVLAFKMGMTLVSDYEEILLQVLKDNEDAEGALRNNFLKFQIYFDPEKVRAYLESKKAYLHLFTEADMREMFIEFQKRKEDLLKAIFVKCYSKKVKITPF